jgi:hypothetical protein
LIAAPLWSVSGTRVSLTVNTAHDTLVGPAARWAATGDGVRSPLMS